MKKVDKKILEYLAEKDWAAESAVVNETFQNFKLSKEEYGKRLVFLKNKDLLLYERPFGNPPFVKITEKGRLKIKSCITRILNFILNHIIEILTLIIATVTLFLELYK